MFFQKLTGCSSEAAKNEARQASLSSELQFKGYARTAWHVAPPFATNGYEHVEPYSPSTKREYLQTLITLIAPRFCFGRFLDGRILAPFMQIVSRHFLRPMTRYRQSETISATDGFAIPSCLPEKNRCKARMTTVYNPAAVFEN